MTYGLYDGDLHRYKQVPFFNLELMKLSTYYKRKHEIVNLAPTFTPNMYSRFLVRQDYPSKTPYSSAYTNVDYGGRTFDGTSYKSLPLEIEQMKADVNLYNKLESRYQSQFFNTMRRAEHIRFSLDEKTIWSDWEKQIRRAPDSFGIIIHDYNLGAIENSFELIQENLNIIKNMNGRRIGMKYPLQIETEQELHKWLSIPPLNQYYSLQYNSPFNLTDFDTLLALRPGTTAQLQTTINVTANINYEDFINTGIVHIFKTILDLRSKHLNFPLIYDKDFFTDYHWVEVIELIRLFNNHIGLNIDQSDYINRIMPYETLYSYAKRASKPMKLDPTFLKRDKVKEIFQFVREHNYELFTLFYEYV